ncbi:hypothetical protein BH10BAC5_BH10BAC5_05560 [soil metagenome]
MKKEPAGILLRSLLIVFFILSFNYCNAGMPGVKFIFADSRTGIKITPGSITLTEVLTGKNIKFSQEELTKNVSEKVIPEGNYLLNVITDGYRSLSTNLNILKNEITYCINLDSRSLNGKQDDKRITSMHSSGSQIYSGYVTDNDSRTPISNVEILCGAANEKFYTDLDGYFEFPVPSSCDGKNYSELIFKKKGYKVKVDKFIENFPGNDIIMKVQLKAGTGTEVIDERNFRRRINEVNSTILNCENCNNYNDRQEVIEKNLADPIVIPSSIKVGRSCTGTNCSTVEIFTLDTYCKYVVPAEVYGCWGSLTGGMNSLQAFATAVRTYASYYVYHPINSVYDICDNTYCQVLGSSQNSYANTAVDNTSRYVLLNGSGNIVRSEYAAENNNFGCGDGFSGTGSAWPCISDQVCSGIASNGHGRGLCQWGSVRWATGTKVLVSSPCSLGVTHGYGTKTWQQILDHYYNVPGFSWTLNQAGTASILNITGTPNPINACGNANLQFSINSTGNLSLFLAASIAPTGTTNWVSDPAHDVKVNLSSGTANYSRQFTVPCNSVPGLYDVLTALWYDKNSNNIIDAGDLIINSKLTVHGLNVQASSGINLFSSEIPDRYFLHQNYPNPFNPTTKIRFDLAGSSFVSVNIFNVSGKRVEKIAGSEMQAGKYEFIWNAVNLPNGIYYCRMETENYSGTIKLVLIK